MADCLLNTDSEAGQEGAKNRMLPPQIGERS